MIVNVKKSSGASVLSKAFRMDPNPTTPATSNTITTMPTSDKRESIMCATNRNQNPANGDGSGTYSLRGNCRRCGPSRRRYGAPHYHRSSTRHRRSYGSLAARGAKRGCIRHNASTFCAVHFVPRGFRRFLTAFESPAACHQIVQRLFLFREARHDEPNVAG